MLYITFRAACRLREAYNRPIMLKFRGACILNANEIINVTPSYSYKLTGNKLKRKMMN